MLIDKVAYSTYIIKYKVGPKPNFHTSRTTLQFLPNTSVTAPYNPHIHRLHILTLAAAATTTTNNNNNNNNNQTTLLHTEV